MMEYVEIFNERIPVLGIGTWKMRGRGCRRSVLSALEMGYRHIDTAEFYRNEREVGQAVNESGVDREDLFLTTKAWSNHFERDAVQQACEDSLKRLGVEYIDLYLMHHPSDTVPLEETLAGMQRLAEQGKTRYIGVSNFSVTRLDRARSISDVPILTNQVEYHPFRQRNKLLAYCQEHDVLLTAYSPLDRGGVMRDRTLQSIGEKYGKTPAQVALRWLIQKDHVITIPKASSKEHQRINMEVFDFELRAEEMNEIDALG